MSEKWLPSRTRPFSCQTRQIQSRDTQNPLEFQESGVTNSLCNLIPHFFQRKPFVTPKRAEESLQLFTDTLITEVSAFAPMKVTFIEPLRWKCNKAFGEKVANAVFLSSMTVKWTIINLRINSGTLKQNKGIEVFEKSRRGG